MEDILLRLEKPLSSSRDRAVILAGARASRICLFLLDQLFSDRFGMAYRFEWSTTVML